MNETFAVGSLVTARGREWVVLPASEERFLVVRPLGGAEDEIAGLHLELERVEPASFAPPPIDRPGDHRSCRLLRDAVRLGFRSSAGPFRSFARLAVEPRPYQLVPLLMALRLDPVRLLIADDVGIGKTIEALLIARELLDRGEVERMAVLCPPQLAEQWQAEMAARFHIAAERVLPSTATRLERHCRLGQSLFEVYPHVVVSTDFIKSDRRRDEFLRACPELVIVDEAHTCAWGGDGRGGRHQRHQLVKRLSENPDRHLLLVTATPHSGNEDTFRSLLAFLNADFASLPEDLSGAHNARHRQRLAGHFVQRRRANIRHYMEEETPFPERRDAEETYALSEGYRRLFDRVLRYARETVQDASGGRHRQRVRWWSALALLRCLASSPAAAAATLRSRAASAETGTAEEADAIGRRAVLDLMDDEPGEGADLAPGSDPEPLGEEARSRRRLLELAREAEQLTGDEDAKLQKAIELVRALLADGCQPIVFCRFIPTAEYVAEALREALRGVEVAAVTSTLPPTERELRVQQLGEADRRVLVCTDCLSEGVNLQAHFDAVLHYDLCWNPTRHEQREGRVDRYGQPRPTVRVLTYWGSDNQIDGIVLDVLLRKHRAIRQRLGYSVPVPADPEMVLEAVFEGLLLREKSGGDPRQLSLAFDEYLKPRQQELELQWDAAGDRETRSRSLFAQERIHGEVDEIARRELAAVREAIGSGAEVAGFVEEAVRSCGGTVSGQNPCEIDLRETPRPLREAVGNADRFRARFQLPVRDDELYLTRTHPLVEGLATHVMDSALDPQGEGRARRSGVILTDQVERRTTLLLLRLRYHLVTVRGQHEHPLLAEDSRLLAFAGSPGDADWLGREEGERLLQAEPAGNVHPDRAAHFLNRVLEGLEALQPRLERLSAERGEELLQAHRQVRRASQARGIRYRVEPILPVDLLGIFVYLPAG